MEFFLGQVQMILPVLGFNFLQPRPAHDLGAPAADRSHRFVMRDVGTSASAVESGGEFIVLKGLVLTHFSRASGRVLMGFSLSR